MAGQIPARSDSCHLCGRAEITSRSRSGARSARNLDVSEHAHMFPSRSERVTGSSNECTVLMVRGSHVSRLRCLRTDTDRRGGATPPQGPTQALRLVPIFNRGRRRSPSHTERFGRPHRRERAAHETIYRGFRLPADLKRGPPEGPSYGLP